MFQTLRLKLPSQHLSIPSSMRTQLTARDPTGLFAVNKLTYATTTSSFLLPQPSANQDTLMNAIRPALLATIKSLAQLAASTLQHATSLSAVQSSEHLLQHSTTGTSLQHTAGTKSNMNAQLSDIGGDICNETELETNESQFAHQPKSFTTAVSTLSEKPKQTLKRRNR